MSFRNASMITGRLAVLVLAGSLLVLAWASSAAEDARAATDTRGSSLVVQFAGLPEWVQAGSGAVPAVVNVTNVGVAPATNVSIYVSGHGTIVAGACAAAAFAGVCTIDSIAPGATVAFPITYAPPAAFGFGSVAAYVVEKDDYASPDVQGYVRQMVESTDGTVQVPYLGFTEWPAIGRAGEQLAYDAVLVNLNDQLLPASDIWVQARTFLEIQAVQSIATSAGACTYVDDNSLGQWRCPIPALQPSQRVTLRFEARSASTAEYRAHYVVALSIPGARPWWDSARGAKVRHEVDTLMNSTRYADVDISVEGPASAQVGSTAVQRVTIANAGPDDARGIEMNGSLRGPGRFVGLTNGMCVGGSRRATCAVGRLAPGAKRTVELSIAALTPGSVQTSYSATTTSFDPNLDDNVIGMGLTSAAKPMPPFKPTLAKAKALTLKRALAAGVAATVSCPQACSVRHQLWLPRKQALRLGIKVPKRGDVLVGTSTKVRTTAGKVTTTVKFKPALRRALTMTRRAVTVRQAIVATAGTAKRAFNRSLVLKLVKAKRTPTR